jgi:hypothetical protein
MPYQLLHECTEMEIRSRAPGSEGRITTEYTPYAI